jgi:hypothetical protein
MRTISTRKVKGKKNRPKIKHCIPDLEHSKAADLRSLGSPDSRRGYQHAMDEFVARYCSEPRLAFNKTVVLRYRFHQEERGLGLEPSTSDWQLCVGWLTRQPTLVCCAPNWQRLSVISEKKKAKEPMSKLPFGLPSSHHAQPSPTTAPLLPVVCGEPKVCFGKNRRSPRPQPRVPC